MDIKKFNLKDSVHISKDNNKNLKIASFNPKYDKVSDASIMLDIPDKQIILNQDSYNSCVAHSLVLCSAILHYKKTNKWINFDPFMVYGTIYDGQFNGYGMYPDQAIDNCIKDGFYFKRDFNKKGERPFICDEVEKFKKENPDLVLQAKDYALTGRATITSHWDVNYALQLGMPVTATWEIYDSFFKTKKSPGLVSVPDIDNEEYMGLHQMTIIGIQDNKNYVVANSYGQHYGFKGLYFIPFEYDFVQAYAVSDTIIPAKPKARQIIMKINNPEIIVDGKSVISDMSPIVINDRTMVPIRIISEYLGSSVEWNQEEQKVTIRSEEALITLTIGDNVYYVDGSQRKLDSPAIVMNDRTMVPIRFISESLNCEVLWNQEEQKVTINCL